MFNRHRERDEEGEDEFLELVSQRKCPHSDVKYHHGLRCSQTVRSAQFPIFGSFFSPVQNLCYSLGSRSVLIDPRHFLQCIRSKITRKCRNLFRSSQSVLQKLSERPKGQSPRNGQIWVQCGESRWVYQTDRLEFTSVFMVHFHW